jgi:hypothetical protein
MDLLVNVAVALPFVELLVGVADIIWDGGVTELEIFALFEACSCSYPVLDSSERNNKCDIWCQWDLGVALFVLRAWLA